MTSSSSRPSSSILRLAVTAAVGLFFALIMIATAKTGPAHSKVVVCYIATWAVYRPGEGSYSIDNFDPNLCTHVVYAFAGLNPLTHDSIVSLDPWQDLKDDYGKNGFERINNIRKTHPHLKVSLAIGGWNEGSANYSMMAADSNKRARFVKQVTSFIRYHKFDGLDLDWEYPTQRGGKPEDKENFVALTKDLRQEFDNHGLILTSAIGAAKHVMDQAYDFKSLTKYLDFLHIMCYDYGGSWDRKVGANAPLNGDGFFNIKFTIDYIIKAGAAPSKIVLGVPFYGRTFVTNNEGNLGDASDDQGFKGPFTRENGFLGYNEICKELSNKSLGWTRTFDEATNQAIIKQHNEEKHETKVVTYDDSRAIANKMRYAVEKSLGGIMVWSVDTDDFLGECQVDSSLNETYVDFGKFPGVQLNIPKRINNNYPLLRTINEGLILAEDEIDQEYQLKRKQQEEDRQNEIPHGEETSTETGSASSVLLNAWILVLAFLCRMF